MDPEFCMPESADYDFFSTDHASAWFRLQEQLMNVPGEEGIQLREERYRPFFHRLGRDVRILNGCYFSTPWRIVLDDNAGINQGAIIEGSSAIRIGRNVRIGHRCFVHSANHDTSDDDPRAFFERGYTCSPVYIGDNVLISANVSIMPGANIGDGAFVAAGAVVTSGDYPAMVRLGGVPATSIIGSPSQQENAKLIPYTPIVFMTPVGDSQATDAARLLKMILGAPGVTIIEQDDAPLPPTAKAVLWFGSEADEPLLDNLSVWTFSGKGPLTTSDEWPYRRTIKTTVTGFNDRFQLNETMRAQFFLASNRALKAPKRTHPEARLVWSIFILLAADDKHGEEGWNHVFNRVGPTLIDPQADGVGWRSRLNAPETILQSTIDARQVQDEGLSNFIDAPSYADFRKVRAVFHGAPELLVHFVAQKRHSAADVARAFVEFIAPHMNTAARLGALGCAYVLLGDDEAADRVLDLLFAPERQVPETNLIKTLPESESIDYSPLLSGFLIAMALKRDSKVLPIMLDVETPLEWRLATEDSPGFLDVKKKKVSRSMLDNWLALQAIPVLGVSSILLDDGCYAPALMNLEKIWRDLMIAMSKDVGAPFISFAPWPSGYHACIALRYDVDRPASAAAIRRIMQIQVQRLNGAAGSWYYLEGAPQNEAVKGILNDWGQEAGLHMRCVSDSSRYVGVTAHSAANSEYWRGLDQIKKLESPAYAEAMGVNFLTPRLGWGDGGILDVWLTPPHYPLEGSTSDTTTDYFDILNHQFKEQLRRGGLAIINSHPDCNQEILEIVIDRLDLEGVWVATVGNAVERVKSIYGPENIGLKIRNDALGDNNGVVDLVDIYSESAVAISDLVVEICTPDGGTLSCNLQLLPNAPRQIFDPN